MVSCFGGEEESDRRASWLATVISSLADGQIIKREKKVI